MTTVQPNHGHVREPQELLLHGFPFNAAMWRDQIDFLDARRGVTSPTVREGSVIIVGLAITRPFIDEDPQCKLALP